MDCTSRTLCPGCGERVLTDLRTGGEVLRWAASEGEAWSYEGGAPFVAVVEV